MPAFGGRDTGSEEIVTHVSIDVGISEDVVPQIAGIRSREKNQDGRRSSWRKACTFNSETTYATYPEAGEVSAGEVSASTSDTPYLSVNYSTDSERKKEGFTLSQSIDGWINGSLSWALFVCLLTIWALFIDDIKLLCMPKSADIPILVANLCVLCVFLMEFCLCWIVQRGYAWSLGALMDGLAAVSLIPFQEILEEVDGVGDSISMARVARAARALRILRATRAAVMALKTESRVQRVTRKLKGEEASVLSDTLMQSTNIKMLLGILVLLMGVTLLEDAEADLTFQTGLDLLDRNYGQEFLPSPEALNTSSQWTSMWHGYRQTVEGMDDDSLQRLKKLKVWGVDYLDLSIDDLRKRELTTASTGDSRSVAKISKRGIIRRQAVNSVLLTIFSTVVIIVWAWSFRRDHMKFVIDPVNRMITLLKQMALDPRQAVDRCSSKTRLDFVGNEMVAIEACIAKFGGLLKVGFGEAGMRIIGRNFRHLDQEGFNPVVPGVIVKAVFGFCDIRNFTDCCEVLNEDTMIFTNRIARIVHELVEESGGTVNKNIGDAFLSVWKVTEVEEEKQKQLLSSKTSLTHTTGNSSCFVADDKSSVEGSGVDERRSIHSQSSGSEYNSTPMATIRSRRTRKSFSHHLTGATDTHDGALRSFLRINECMRSSPEIQALSADPRLQKKIPGYTVRLGSGLHFGWAIEGAVGTAHKVDATYLSPHVNMAARLEAATKQYGVNILLSEALVNGLTMELYSECRPIDRVTVKGSAKPLILYVHMPSESPELTEDQRCKFMDLWNSAFIEYQSGNDWHEAAELMKRCLEILPRDEPAKVLLQVIRDAGGRSPPGWPGYRELTSK